MRGFYNYICYRINKSLLQRKNIDNERCTIRSNNILVIREPKNKLTVQSTKLVKFINEDVIFKVHELKKDFPINIYLLHAKVKI